MNYILTIYKNLEELFAIAVCLFITHPVFHLISVRWSMFKKKKSCFKRFFSTALISLQKLFYKHTRLIFAQNLKQCKEQCQLQHEKKTGCMIQRISIGRVFLLYCISPLLFSLVVYDHDDYNKKQLS